MCMRLQGVGVSKTNGLCPGMWTKMGLWNEVMETWGGGLTILLKNRKLCTNEVCC